MKAIYSVFALFLLFTATVTAQVKTSTFKVSGNCGMCKKTIEGAAKSGGASFASWDMNSKLLTVKYAAGKSSSEKIQKAIADAGYDNEKFTATDAAYDGLHECCKYERKQPAGTAVADVKGSKESACCTKDGTCTGDMACCKKANGKADCCKDGKCTAAAGCCKNMNCSKETGACCVKDGKCTAEKACCKKMDGQADCCKDGKCSAVNGCCADMKCSSKGSCCKNKETIKA